jgi:N-acetylmuramic acid 6-phosphate etherase
MSLADALEIPATFGIPRNRLVLLFADGAEIAQRLNGGREDSDEDARTDVTAAGIGPKDCVIAISASGTTRYTLAGLETAKAAGAATVAIAGNRGAPLLAGADIQILIESGPEVVSGSTRLGAGTAQKAALNMLSTLVGVRLGHVHDGLMVNVQADNEKLRGRAARIVMQIAQVGEEKAHEALAASGGLAKPAVLIAFGVEPAEAAALLARNGENLRSAMTEIGVGPRPLARLGQGLGRGS